MSEENETNELIEAFLSLCLEQKKQTKAKEMEEEKEKDNSSNDFKNKNNFKEEELKNSALLLAKKLYTKAAALERSGDISKAIELYNRAYRLDPEIDRNINHIELAAEISKKDLSEIEPYYNPFKKVLRNNPIDRELYFIILQSLQSSKLESVEESSTVNEKDNVFKLSNCNDSKSSVNFLQELPADVLNKILQFVGWMHLPSLETISLTSRSLFLACRQEEIWKFLCERVECECHPRATTAETQLIYDSWRHQFIVRPHFRTDGLYISKITYFRQGYQETAISQPSHLITYFRYLRFFNDSEISGGRLVISFVSTEQPRKVIDLLKEIDMKNLQAIKNRFFNNSTSIKQSSLKDKNNKNNKLKKSLLSSDVDLKIGTKPNLFVGSYWRSSKHLDSDRIFHLILFDAHSKNPMKLKMKMELADPEKGPGYRSAKCVEYTGNVIVGEGEREQVHFDTQKWGKFHFSRVKTY